MKPNKYFVSKFDNVNDVVSRCIVDLFDWLLVKNKYTKVVEQIRETEDEYQKKKLKTTLPAVTISCTCSRRHSRRIINRTGLICIDIDGKDNPDYANNINSLKNRIFKLDYIMYCGLSTSGNGLFCIIKIADTQKHSEHFCALEKDFADIGIVVDSQCKDICRLRFYSFDDNPIVKNDAVVYEKILSSSSGVNKLRQKPRDEHSREVSIKTFQRDVSTFDYFNQSNNYYNPLLMQILRGDEKGAVKDIVSIALEEVVDITDRWQDWFLCCCVIAKLFGEDGRDIFHKVSCMYDRYTSEECNNFFSYVLKKGYRKSSKDMLNLALSYRIV